jgi:hypothetical protein
MWWHPINSDDVFSVDHQKLARAKGQQIVDDQDFGPPMLTILGDDLFTRKNSGDHQRYPFLCD